MHIGKKIKALKDRKGLSNSEFARMLDMTENNLFSVFRREESTTGILKKVIEITGVTPNYFFSDSDNGQISNGNSITGNKVLNASQSVVNTENYSGCIEQVKVLRELIESKDSQIAVLKDINEYLKALKNVS